MSPKCGVYESPRTHPQAYPCATHPNISLFQCPESCIYPSQFHVRRKILLLLSTKLPLNFPLFLYKHLRYKVNTMVLQVYLDPITVNSRKVLAGLDLLGTEFNLNHVDCKDMNSFFKTSLKFYPLGLILLLS